jgi:Amt family ammonium transporter
MASKESANAVAMVFLNTNAAAAGGVIAALLLDVTGCRKT